MTEEIIELLQAITEAEEAGRDELVCPMCGSNARIGRSDYNHHLWYHCDQCGLTLME